MARNQDEPPSSSPLYQLYSDPHSVSPAVIPLNFVQHLNALPNAAPNMPATSAQFQPLSQHPVALLQNSPPTPLAVPCSSSAAASTAAADGVTHVPADTQEPCLDSSLCAGLQYANMRKEEAREEFKERRRRELLEQGEVDRVKRRKKNDTSMSNNQKYHRRLKMNQDSAAAARHAQEVYVQTLEELVATAEAEKHSLVVEASSLRAERNRLVSRLCELQTEIVRSGTTSSGSQQNSDVLFGNKSSVFDLSSPGEPLNKKNQADQIDDSDSIFLLRKVFEFVGSPEGPSAVRNEEDFAAMLSGIMPARAV